MNNIKILKDNSIYRINDVVYMFGEQWDVDREEILSNKRYEGTILRDYLETKRYELDFETLSERCSSGVERLCDR